MQKFLSDTRAVYAIEFAFLFPFIIVALAMGISVAQHQDLNSQANYLAQIGATAAANYYVFATGNAADPNKPNLTPQACCQALALAVVTQDFSLMNNSGSLTMDAPVFTYPTSGGAMNQTTVTITLHTPSMFPMFGDTLTSTASATQ